jgi:translation initiation factor 2D
MLLLVLLLLLLLLLQAIVKSLKDAELPLNSSTLWTQHITPSRPPGGSSSSAAA